MPPLGCDRKQREQAKAAHGEEAGSCDSKASFFSTAKYTVIAMNRVRFANTQFLNEMSTYIDDFVSSKR